MNIKNNRPFQEAEIDIVEITLCDVITASSPEGPDPFPGEDDDFTAPYFWNN